MNDYLWDKSGSDPEIESLERLLAPAALAAPRARTSRRIAWIAGLAAAALFAFGAVRALDRTRTQDRWVAMEDGRKSLSLGPYGSVVAEPGTKVRVLRQDDERQSLRLDRGTIHASITTVARPRLFQVETPGATCIDLGCHYTLSVDKDGVTRVSVDSGRVLFDLGDREIFIPEGASGKAAPGRPPLTPIHDNASDALKRAVEAFDATSPGARTGQAKEACRMISRRQDGLVAWHWLQDPEPGVQAAAREALVRLTRIIECGVHPPSKDETNELRGWRNRLFPEWQSWD